MAWMCDQVQDDSQHRASAQASMRTESAVIARELFLLFFQPMPYD
jgi:hypothetical protein